MYERAQFLDRVLTIDSRKLLQNAGPIPRYVQS